jgi:hypothetical protein
MPIWFCGNRFWVSGTHLYCNALKYWLNMTAIEIGALVFAFLISWICGISGTLKTQRMVNDVISKLPLDQKFSQFGWYASKYRALFGEYRRLYPEGKLIDEIRMLGAGALLLPVMGCAVFDFGILIDGKRFDGRRVPACSITACASCTRSAGRTKRCSGQP